MTGSDGVIGETHRTSRNGTQPDWALRIAGRKRAMVGHPPRRPREAIIPARQVIVRASAESALEAAAPRLNDKPTTDTADTSKPRFWQGLSAGFAALWFATALAWWRQKSGRPAASVGPLNEDTLSLTQARTRLRQACTARDAPAARVALLAWAQARWPARPPAGLVSLASQIKSPSLHKELGALDRFLYAPGQPHWDGKSLWAAADAQLRPVDNASRNSTSPLAPLNPTP